MNLVGGFTLLASMFAGSDDRISKSNAAEYIRQGIRDRVPSLTSSQFDPKTLAGRAFWGGSDKAIRYGMSPSELDRYIKEIILRAIFPQSLQHLPISGSLLSSDELIDVYFLIDPIPQKDGWSCGYRMAFNAAALQQYFEQVRTATEGEETAWQLPPASDELLSQLNGNGKDEHVGNSVDELTRRRQKRLLLHELDAEIKLIQRVDAMIGERNLQKRELINQLLPGYVSRTLILDLAGSNEEPHKELAMYFLALLGKPVVLDEDRNLEAEEQARKKEERFNSIIRELESIFQKGYKFSVVEVVAQDDPCLSYMNRLTDVPVRMAFGLCYEDKDPKVILEVLKGFNIQKNKVPEWVSEVTEKVTDILNGIKSLEALLNEAIRRQEDKQDAFDEAKKVAHDCFKRAENGENLSGLLTDLDPISPSSEVSTVRDIIKNARRYALELINRMIIECASLESSQSTSEEGSMGGAALSEEKKSLAKATLKQLSYSDLLTEVREAVDEDRVADCIESCNKEPGHQLLKRIRAVIEVDAASELVTRLCSAVSKREVLRHQDLYTSNPQNLLLIEEVKRIVELTGQNSQSERDREEAIAQALSEYDPFKLLREIREKKYGETAERYLEAADVLELDFLDKLKEKRRKKSLHFVGRGSRLVDDKVEDVWQFDTASDGILKEEDRNGSPDDDMLSQKIADKVAADLKKKKLTTPLLHHFFVCFSSDPIHWIVITLINMPSRARPLVCIVDSCNSSASERTEEALAFLYRKFMKEPVRDR